MSPAIRSHTIQKRGGLSAIAENGHVLTAKITPESLFNNEGEVKLRRIGIGDASTFPGFCEAHDAELFRVIENKIFALSAETVFTFSYRAIAYEAFTKVAALENVAVQRDMDKGREFERQISTQRFLADFEYGTKLGEESCRKWKAAYDNCIRTSDLSSFHFMAFELNPPLPIAACGAFYPEYDFEGRPLQDLTIRDPSYEHVSLNVTSWEGRGIAVLGWFNHGSGAANRFASSLKKVPGDRMADAVVRLCFEHLENIYVRPSAWDQLGDLQKNSLLARVPSGGPSVERRPNCLSDDAYQYWTSQVVAPISRTVDI